MMVVVVDTRKPLCIKGIILQQPYNQNTFVSILDSHLHGCTLIVMQRPYRTRLSAQLQLQQQILILKNYDKYT